VHKGYERKSIYSIEEIRGLTKDVLFEPDKKNAKVELDGDIIKGNSQRYQTFFTNGVKCACCGIEGKYFAKEKNINATAYHLNLYAIDENGKEVLMTKDHIIPRSKGGKNHISNYQTMCVRCNVTKGNQL
jgi:5-methylcytosine-specific restriction endonuclease McrA